MNGNVPNQPGKKSSVDEYLATERHGASKNEFHSGKIIGLSGSNRWHNLIVSNVVVGIGSRVHGHRCEIYISNIRVKLDSNFICYPDIAVVSGEPEFTDRNLDVLTNPTFLVDVFSSEVNSSAKTTKLESFLAMSSIKECLLIKEDEMRIEHYAKQNAKQWIYKIYDSREDVISIDSIGCKISLQEIYSQVKLRQTELSSRAVN